MDTISAYDYKFIVEGGLIAVGISVSDEHRINRTSNSSIHNEGEKCTEYSVRGRFENCSVKSYSNAMLLYHTMPAESVVNVVKRNTDVSFTRRDSLSKEGSNSKRRSSYPLEGTSECSTKSCG